MARAGFLHRERAVSAAADHTPETRISRAVPTVLIASGNGVVSGLAAFGSADNKRGHLTIGDTAPDLKLGTFGSKRGG